MDDSTNTPPERPSLADWPTRPMHSYPPLDMLSHMIRLRDQPELPLGLPEVKRYDWLIRKMKE